MSLILLIIPSGPLKYVSVRRRIILIRHAERNEVKIVFIELISSRVDHLSSGKIKIKAHATAHMGLSEKINHEG